MAEHRAVAQDADSLTSVKLGSTISLTQDRHTLTWDYYASIYPSDGGCSFSDIGEVSSGNPYS